MCVGPSFSPVGLMELTMVEPPSFSWASSFSAWWCWFGFFGHTQIFLRVSRGGTTDPRWFIWSRSACYSPARAYVYTLDGYEYSSASLLNSITYSSKSRDVADARRNLRESKNMKLWLVTCASSPSLLVSPFSFTLSFRKDEWALQFLFSRVFNVACC